MMKVKSAFMCLRTGDECNHGNNRHNRDTMPQPFTVDLERFILSYNGCWLALFEGVGFIFVYEEKETAGFAFQLEQPTNFVIGMRDGSNF